MRLQNKRASDSLRSKNLAALKASNILDVFIAGGGINGAAVFNALSAAGLKTALCDKGDFASATSMQSSNLVWGGIKYMENLEFNLVKDLCASRNRLMRAFPENVREMRFLTAPEKGFRHSRFTLYIGTWIYWLFGRGRTKIPALRSVKKLGKLEHDLRLDLTDGGFEYSDCYLPENDARFSWNFIRAGLNFGGTAVNYAEVVSAVRTAGVWKIKIKCQSEIFTVKSRVLFNAAGAFLDNFNRANHLPARHKHILSKGVHLIVPRIGTGRRILTFFATDGRMFFIIPMGKKSCVGTTDTRVLLPDVTATNEDIQFILDNINKHVNLKKPLNKKDVLSVRCGVRPLAVPSKDPGSAGEWTQLSRRHVMEVHAKQKLIHLFGGKLTDCLNIGEEAVHEISSLGIKAQVNPKWFGEPGKKEKKNFFKQCRAASINHDASLRLWRKYMTGAFEILKKMQTPHGREVILKEENITRAELEYASEHEMIFELGDFLRRRTRIELERGKAACAASADIKHAAKILFAEETEQKIKNYRSAS